jgi:hypothetical protein
MIAFAALVLVESLAIDLLILSQLRMHWLSEARLTQAKKKPRFRGVVVLHGALDSVVVVLVLLCAPSVGVLDCAILVVDLFSGLPPAELFPLPVFLVRPSPPSTRGR